jgi:hypothetical protein
MTTTATYTINNLGTFNKYTPASAPNSYNGYYKRAADNADLGTFLANPANFSSPYSLKILLVVQGSIVGPYSGPSLAVAYDAATLPVPPSAAGVSTVFLIEVLDYVGYDQLSAFSNTSFDLDTTPGKAIVTQPYPYVYSHALLPVWQRVTSFEAQVLEMEVLASLELRDRKILELSVSMQSTDPLFQRFAAAAVAAFGPARAQVLLAQ